MHQSQNNNKTPSLEIPPKPKEPSIYECCGRGCDPCIFDYYAKALKRWQQRVAELEKQNADCKNPCNSD